jgi:predicted flap endonuclease-1-like 5' DNA nuclease
MSKSKINQPDSAFPKGVARPAQRAIASLGVTRLDQVTRFTEDQLMALHGMGPKAMRIIKAALRAQRKSLAKDKQPSSSRRR